MPMTMSKSPAMLFEYLPNNEFPILLPSITPRKMEITENNPIEIEAKNGETPVMPTPKPIVKQLMASTNPNNNDSFRVIDFSLFNFGNTDGQEASFIT